MISLVAVDVKESGRDHFRKAEDEMRKGAVLLKRKRDHEAPFRMDMARVSIQ